MYGPPVRIVAPSSREERRAGDNCLGREKPDQVARLYITTLTRGTGWPLLPNEGVPSHADEMRRMDCRGFEVLYFTNDRLGSRDNKRGTDEVHPCQSGVS